MWQLPSKLKVGELTKSPLAGARRRLRRKSPCESFTPASKKPSLARKSPSVFLRKLSPPSAESWRLSRSGRPAMPDVAPSANICSTESTSGISLRRWRSNSMNGSGAGLRLRTSKRLPRAGINSSTLSRFVAKASASRRYSRFTLPENQDGTALIWTNGRNGSRSQADGYGSECAPGWRTNPFIDERDADHPRSCAGAWRRLLLRRRAARSRF